MKNTYPTKCIKCDSQNFIGREYMMTTEWNCTDCGLRWGRWSLKELKEGELEKSSARFNNDKS